MVENKHVESESVSKTATKFEQQDYLREDFIRLQHKRGIKYLYPGLYRLSYLVYNAHCAAP